jgi:histone H3/H4
LAPTSKTIQSSPREEANLKKKDEIDEIDELDNEPVLERPRLSLQIDDDTGEDGEESPDIPPPRLSLAFEEEDITQRSVEYPRRALSEQERRRFSRMSFGDVRLSENFGDLSRMDGISEGRDNTITLQQVNDDEGLEDTTVEQGTFDAGGETEDLRRFNLEFNFPTPTAPGPEDTDLVRANDDEGFMLDAEDMQPDMGSSPSTGGDAAAGFGFDIHMSDRGSETEALGIVGGGLHDEPLEHGRKGQKISKHGIPVPNLPSGVVKKLAMRFARTGTGAKLKIKKDVLAAIDQASSWFFEQAGEDLATYSKHAKRKIINESDVITLMRR